MHVDGDTGPGGPTVSRATGVLKRFILGSGNLGGCPLISHKAGRQAGGLHVPAWRPGVVGQGGGTLRGSSQGPPDSSPSPRSGGLCLRAQRRSSPP